MWICCQIGAREHYAVPRALHAEGTLCGLLTDAWVRPGSPIGALKRNLRERFHPSLDRAPVKAWTLGLVAFEMIARARRLSGWPLILARNQWFQKQAVRALDRLKPEILKADPQPSTVNSQPILFSYSYAAREPFRWARQGGWKTILGQIDPGPAEERIVERMHREHPHYAGAWQPAPPAYWRAWREECNLAQMIVVNSEWSRQALMEEGLPEAKITIVPLAYETPEECRGFERNYPSAFSPERPLRVLFLGQVNLRKGVECILDALPLLEGEPVEFRFVGPVCMQIPESYRRHPRVRWLGPAPRGEVDGFYREADLFLFPTHSDGFGLTQLEAMAWKLPVVASCHCGRVVEDGANGVLLPKATAESLAQAVRDCIRRPDRLVVMSRACYVKREFSVAALAGELQAASTVCSRAAA